MSITRKRYWPEGLGFSIFGEGPSFIVDVKKNSVAEESGLKPGDQILQVNDVDVANWPAEKIIDFVERSKSPPPSLGVVSRIKEVTLMASSSSDSKLFGLSLTDFLPVMVSHVTQRSPASNANLKINDILIKIEGKCVTNADEARHLLGECKRGGVAQVGVVPASFNKIKPKVPPKKKSKGNKTTDGKLKAKSFLDLVKKSFQHHPLEIENVVSAIKAYSKLKDTDRFVFSLCRSFRNIENGKQLVERLRFFIPQNCKDQYDMSLQKYWKREDIGSTSCSSLDFSTFESDGLVVPPSGKCTVSLQHDGGANSYMARIRSITVKRGKRNFGLTLRGCAPIEIQAVDIESPAFEANLKDGDQILAVNGIDIRNVEHSKAVALIQGSGSMPTLVIHNSTGALPNAVSPVHSYIMKSEENLYGNRLESPKLYSRTDKNNNTRSNNIEYNNLHAKHDWADDYVPDGFQVGGLNFREQIGKLLDSNEIRVLRIAMLDFMESRNLNSLFFQIFPFLDGIDDRRRVIWLYIFVCLTEAERQNLKQKLLDFAQYNISDEEVFGAQKNLKEPEKTPSPEKAPVEPFSCNQTNNKPSSPASTSVQLCKDSLLKEEPKINQPNSETSPQRFSTGNAPSTSGTSHTRRHRRRKTVEKVHFSPEERLRTYDVTDLSTISTDVVVSPQNLSNTPMTSQSVSPIVVTDVDNSFYDNRQQQDRRRRRELSSRRRRSLGVVTSEVTSKSNQLNQDSPSKSVSTVERRPGILRSPHRQRPRRNTVEISTTTTTTSEETVLSSVVSNTAGASDSPGDKKSSKKQKNSEPTAPVSPPSKPVEKHVIPSTSIDDLVFEDDLIEQQQLQYSKSQNFSNTRSLSQPSGSSRDLDSSRRSKSLKINNDDSGSYTERDRFNQSKTSVNNSTYNDSPKYNVYNSAQGAGTEVNSKPKSNNNHVQDNKEDRPIKDFSVFNEFSNAEEMSKKKGVMSNLKKRLTFSRPPKNTDTDTFLSELSAQFDEEMHLVGDVEIEENPSQGGNRFGEKWSYLPNKSSELTGIDPNVEPEPERPKPQESPKLHFESGDRTLERDRQRRRRRRADNGSRQEPRGAFQETNLDDLLFQPPPEPNYPKTTLTSPAISANQEVIYDVPKPVASTQTGPRRSHVNIERRRRSRANRPLSLSVNRNSAEVKMHVWTEGDKTSTQYEVSSGVGGENTVKLRSPSPERQQASFFDRAKKRNYRVSGISMNMEDIFSEAEEDLQTHDEIKRTASVEKRFEDPDEIYAPLHEEVLALGLAYEDETQSEREEREREERERLNQKNNLSTEASVIPPPPILPDIPPPPVLSAIPPPPDLNQHVPIPPPPSLTDYPATLSPPGLFKNPTSPVRMSVKRINWEKIEPVDLGNTVWGQLGEDYDTINDVVKYLDLEEHFSVKKTVIKKKPKVEKKVSHTILAHKKAYNLSILLAHLKLTRSEIYNCLLIAGPESVRKRLDASHYEQLLLYAPDKTEIEDLKAFDGDTNKLNDADKLAVKLVTIPGYELRLKALAFKYGFAEREEEIRKNLEVIQKAAMQLRKSRKLAKILEFVLAMGNYMNQGHIRISKATGFRIHFLAEMDYTKTSDNKLTFLHILARAVSSKFPDVVTFADEISEVKDAARVVYPAVLEELQEIRKVWLDIRDNLLKTVSKIKQDRFKIAMETCLVRTNGAIKRLEQLHNATVKEFNKVAQYFGENPKNIGMQQFFKIFEQFTRKFLKSHYEIKRLVKSKSDER